ncbi:hypothetical protein ccbrp13_01570 [Ktedonobacteria bacterium brp13]|nr:hypothetical protein ccbrp13_01570 [Ktedonobacteria bacterium brp13]
MQEQLKQQPIPLKVYRADQRLMIAAPMPGLEPENIVVEVTADGNVFLHGELRGRLKEVYEKVKEQISLYTVKLLGRKEVAKGKEAPGGAQSLGLDC